MRFDIFSTPVTLTVADAPVLAFVALLIVTGAVISIDDLRTGKIRNKWILAGLACGAGTHIFFVVFFSLMQRNLSVRPEYLEAVLLNSVMAFGCGYFLWKMRVWSAGDAKLFFLFAFLVPLEFYSRGMARFFPAFSLLINIFFVSVVIVILQVIYSYVVSGMEGMKMFRADIGALLKSARDNIVDRWQAMLGVLLVFSIVYMGLDEARRHLSGRNASLVFSVGYMIFVFAVMRPVAKQISDVLGRRSMLKNVVIASIGVAVVLMVIYPELGRAAIRKAEYIAVFMLTVSSVWKLVDLRLEHMDTLRVKVRDIRAGDVAGPEIKEQVGGVDIGAQFMDGFSREQVGLIRDLLSEDEELVVFKTVPFAPMAFVGVLLTLFLRQSVVHLFMNVGR